jgi:hypothetical protein
MLMPKKVKYRKVQRGRRAGKAWRGGSLAFGEFGVSARPIPGRHGAAPTMSIQARTMQRRTPA